MSKQQFIFLIGLPGSGKSYWLVDYHIKYPEFSIVSADIIKAKKWNSTPADDRNPSFNKFCEEFHEESTKLAEEEVYTRINNNESVILDGGGINRSYNLRIISHIQKLKEDIEVKAYYFNTPIEICLKRLQIRDRKVPIEDIYRKNQLLPLVLNRYKSESIEIETISYFTNKYIFFDMDGTLCSVNDPVKDIHGNVDFVNTEFFLNSKPLDPALNLLYNSWLHKKECFILTACPNSISLCEKLQWLRKHFGEPEFYDQGRVFWVGNKDYKHIFLQQYLIGKKIDPKDVLYIDDSLEIIEKMRGIGVNTKHVSQL